MVELYRKYRPTKIRDLIGQPEAQKVLTKMIAEREIPHAVLLTGPSGCGKTTIGRILAGKLGCAEHEFREINAATARGIDMVREVDRESQPYAMLGKSRVFLFDEAHQLTRESQSGLLKMLEDPPDHSYFMLATNEPQKLLHAIRTRCTKIKVNPLSFENLQKVITSVADKAGIEVPQRVINRIAEVSEGSAREALVLLQKVRGLKTEGDMLAAVLSSEVKQSAWDLTKALLYEGRKRPNWGRIAKILKDLEGEEVEGIRHLILVNARGVLYKGGPQAVRAAAIMDMMIDTLFESKHPGLALACYRICNPS